MVGTLLEFLARIVIFLISKLGYLGIVLAMGIESASIPLPSEIIMPFSGFLVYQGHFQLLPVAFAGTIGCLWGSLLAWFIGRKYGEQFIRNLIRKYGKYLLVFEYELDEAIRIFNKRGEVITFVARLLPIIRTFISLPAGIAKMEIKKFAFYTFSGSFIWSLVLAWIGMKLGENWEMIGRYFRKFDFLIGIAILAAGFYYISHKLKKYNNYLKNKLSPPTSPP